MLLCSFLAFPLLLSVPFSRPINGESVQMRIVADGDGEDKSLEIGAEKEEKPAAYEGKETPIRGEAECPHGQHSSFIIEHQRPFEGPLLQKPLLDVASVDECAKRCAMFIRCAGANFLVNLAGDPVCSLHAEPRTEASAAADTPLLVMFGLRRFCLANEFDSQCGAPWTFQRFPHIGLINEHLLIDEEEGDGSGPPPSLDKCLGKCHAKPQCAGALWSERSRSCRLSRASPQNVHGVRRYFRPDPEWDMFELNCVRAESLSPWRCAFHRISHAGFSNTFGALMKGVHSPEECQAACLDTLDRRQTISVCRAWTHDADTSRCYLNHLALRSLGRNVLEQQDPALSSGEMDECMDFKLQCGARFLRLSGFSPLKLFHGMVRPKRGDCCERRVEQLEHSFSVELPFQECGFEQKADSHFGALLVKEGSTELITTRDKMVQVTCRLHRNGGKYSPPSLPLLNIRIRHNSSSSAEGNQQPQPRTVGFPSAGVQQRVATRVMVLQDKQPHRVPPPEGPQYRLEVLDENGDPVQRVEMGRRGFLEIRRVDTAASSSRQDTGGLLLTELKALDNANPDGAAMPLIGPDGCVANSSVVTSIEQLDANRLRIGIHFSGYADKTRVSYQGLVKRCQFACVPDCNRHIHVGGGVPAEAEEAQSDPNNIRLRRATALATAAPATNRHFRLSEDVWEVRSRVMLGKQEGGRAATEAPEEQDQKVRIRSPSVSPVRQVLGCLGEVNCACSVLLAAIQALLVLVCGYLLLTHLKVVLAQSAKCPASQSWLLRVHAFAALLLHQLIRMARVRRRLPQESGERAENGNRQAPK